MAAPIIALCANAKESAAIHYLSSPQIRCVTASSAQALGYFISASAVIFSRNLFEASRLLRAARDIGIPRYYFLDENVLTMREEPQHHTHYFHEHSEAALRSELQEFTCVLVPNVKLANYLCEKKIHRNIIELPPTVAKLPVHPAARTIETLKFKKTRVVRLAYFSARMRQGLFAQVVLPALRKLAYLYDIELIAFGCAPHSLDDPSSPLRVRTPEWEPNYENALAALQSWNPEIILQPDLETMSTPYKMPHLLLSAARIGAVLVASNIAPYTDLTNQARPPIVLAANTCHSWEESIRLLLDSASLRLRLASNAISCVREMWPIEANLKVILHISQQHKAPDLVVRSARVVTLEPHLNAMKNLVTAQSNEHRLTIHAQSLAIEQYKRDVSEINASLDDSRRILASLKEPLSTNSL